MGFKIMDNNDDLDKFNLVARIIGLDGDMRDEIINCFNSDDVLKNRTALFLINNFLFHDVVERLINNFSAPYSFKSLFFVYALASKSLPDFKDSFLLCSFNVNFLDMLEKGRFFSTPEKRIISVIDFYNNICDTEISIPYDIGFLVKDDGLFKGFLGKVKDEIFLKKELDRDDLYDFKKCLLKINCGSNWNYHFKEEIFLNIERRYLDASISNSLVDKKSSCKI